MQLSISDGCHARRIVIVSGSCLFQEGVESHYENHMRQRDELQVYGGEDATTTSNVIDHVTITTNQHVVGGGGSVGDATEYIKYRGRVEIGGVSEPIFVSLLRSPGIDSQPGGPVRQPFLMYRPARLNSLAESIPGLLKRLQIRALPS